MINNLINTYKNLKVWIVDGVVVGISLIVGIFLPPFRYGFLNTLGILTAILFFIGIFRQAWIKGDFTSIGFQRSKKVDPSYAAYRRRILDERKDKDNIAIYASVVLIVLCIILPRFI